MAHGLGTLVSKDAEKSKQMSDSMTQNMKKCKTLCHKVDPQYCMGSLR